MLSAAAAAAQARSNSDRQVDNSNVSARLIARHLVGTDAIDEVLSSLGVASESIYYRFPAAAAARHCNCMLSVRVMTPAMTTTQL